jgi:uncharacterized membrane protein
VTIPTSACDDVRIRGFKVRYTLAMALVTAGATALVVSAVMMGGQGPATVSLIVAVLLIPALSFALMLLFRSRTMGLKREMGWETTSAKHSAIVAEVDIPGPVSLGWEALNVPVIIATFAVGLILYPSMPDQVPMHMDLTGAVTDWTAKSTAIIVFPVLVQVVILASMVLAHWGITHSKKASSPSAPVSSAYAYGLYAHAQSVLLVVLGVVINLAMVCIPLSFAGIMTLPVAALVVTLVAMVSAVASMVMGLVYGQAGSRIVARVEAAADMPADDDSHWAAGVLYVNRDEPALFLPERFGMGWTVNLARPAVWAIIAGFVAVIVALLVFSMTTLG